jgi:hypothetical protein
MVKTVGETMIAEVRQWLDTYEGLLEWLFVFSVGTFVVAILLSVIGIVYLPRDYFSSGYKPFSHKISNPFLRRLYLAVKNVVGVVIILTGMAFLVLPGQGILTIVIGLSLTDFPGKHKAVSYFTRRDPLLRSANWLRRKAGKRPLQNFEGL